MKFRNYTLEEVVEDIKEAIHQKIYGELTIRLDRGTIPIVKVMETRKKEETIKP